MKKGLGKGLDALFGGYTDTVPDQELKDKDISQVDIMDIDPNPNQPRKTFDQEKLDDLARSIKDHGLVQPIALVRKGDRYTIVAGERRWRAARKAGLKTVPALVMDLTEKEVLEIALVENLQREDLNPIEEAEGIRSLIDQYKLTQDEVASRLGRSRPAIANSLRLLRLDKKLQAYLIDGKLTPGHGRALLAISDEKARQKVAKTIIEKDLNVRDTERLIKKLSTPAKQTQRKTKEIPLHLAEIELNLEEALGTRVQIKPGKKKSIIVIEYYNDDDLERIIERLQ